MAVRGGGGLCGRETWQQKGEVFRKMVSNASLSSLFFQYVVSSGVFLALTRMTKNSLKYHQNKMFIKKAVY